MDQTNSNDNNIQYIINHILPNHWVNKKVREEVILKIKKRIILSNDFINKRIEPFMEYSKKGVKFDNELNSEIILLLSFKFLLKENLIITYFTKCDFLNAMKVLFQLK
jgi:hypothetical protein